MYYGATEAAESLVVVSFRVVDPMDDELEAMMCVRYGDQVVVYMEVVE